MMLDRANWIWLSDCNEVNSYVDFKRNFKLEKDRSVEIEISVDGNYALYLNDVFVNSGQYPDYPEYKVYDRLDLSGVAKEGDNELLIRVWWPGKDHFSYRVEQPGLLYAVFSGEEVLALSDRSTQAALNCAFQNGDIYCLTGQLGYGFSYDARNEGDEIFEPACIVEKGVTLYPRPIKKVDIGARACSKLINYGTFSERPWEFPGERMQYAALSAKYWGPESVWNGESGTIFSAPGDDGIYLIFDLGCEQVGFADIELDLPEDALVLCGYGEHLYDLRVRTFVGRRNFVFSYQGKAGKNHFFMPLRRLGLRYLQLHIYTHSVKMYYAGIRPTTYPLAEYPIEIKDRLHRKIYEVCIQTLRHCMHDHYEDSPWREQGLYTMDSRNEMLCGYDIFHETVFPKACLRLIALSVREDGLAELCSPARASITIPSFSAAYLLQLWDYLEYSGDLDFIREILPCAEKIAEGFVNHIDPETGLLTAYTDKKYWNFYEWQDGLSGKHGVEDLNLLTYDAPLCAFVSMAFQAMEKIYHALGMQDQAEAYKAYWTALNRKTEETFWNGKWYNTYKNVHSGTLSHDCELTQALMICCGACPENKISGVRELLKGKEALLPVTISYSIFKYTAIMTDPQNYDWMMDDVAEIWGNMLFNGATTFWETAKGASDFHNAGSLCHGWSAVPLHLYHKYGRP
ncbi:MAG: hypothetical protein IJ043_01260 [Clostridia bacterium]|nr:hypothetical protein [Clostridia bacterium]